MTDVDLDDLRANAWRLSPERFAEKLSDGEYLTPPHVRVIAREIRRTILQDNGRLIINLPPRHAKSETVSHWTPAWGLSMDPTLRFGLGSYEADFAAEWGRKVRNTLQANTSPLGQILSRDSTAASRFNTVAGGGLWTGGIGSAITGRGFHVGVIDDPHKNYADAHSATRREAVWNWYLSTFYTRKQTGSSIIIVHTRWHEDDLTGRLLQADQDGAGEDWTVIRMPAIAEEREEWELGGGETWVREEGEALWPEAYPLDDLTRTKRSIGLYLWTGLYQQRPAPPEGGLVKRGDWRYWTELPGRFQEQIITLDCTFKDESDSDFVVMQAWGRRGADRFLLDQIRARLSFTDTCDTLVQFLARHRRVGKVLVEDKANGTAVVNSLRGKVPGMIPWPRKEAKAGNISKQERVVASSPAIESHNVYLPDPSVLAQEGRGGISETFDVGTFVEEWAEFPNGAHDDQVDAGTMALLEWGALAPSVSGPMRSRTAANQTEGTGGQGTGGKRSRRPRAAETDPRKRPPPGR